MAVSSGQSFKYKTHGVQETMTLLLNFPRKLRTKTLRKAGNEASKLGLKTMKQLLPPKNRTWGTGYLRKSLGRKVIVYKGLVLVYLVGPRSKFFAIFDLEFRFWRDSQGRIRKAPTAGFKTAGPGAESYKRRRPVNYMHLVNRRHDILRRAMQRSRPQELRAMERVLREAVENPRG